MKAGRSPELNDGGFGSAAVCRSHCGVTWVLSKFAAVGRLLELDIGPGRLQAHSATQNRRLTGECNRLHDRHRAPLGAGGLEGFAT
jgi:hypothetical protein